MTSISPKAMSGTLGDTQVVKRTYMDAVPLILDRIVKGVNNVAHDQGFLKWKIFSTALEIKKKQNASAFVNKILDFVVFNKVKKQLGGELRLILVGEAPLSADTHTNIRALFGCDVQVGYGASATTACISARGTATPCHGFQVTLMDWEDGGYCTTDKPHPRGEILVAGPTGAKDYFRPPEMTQEAFVAKDGQMWYVTGDIAQIDDCASSTARRIW